MAPRRGRLLGALAATALPILVTASPAHAAGELQIVVDSADPAAGLDRLAPGVTWQSTFTASNTSGDDAALWLRVVDLEEDDNGCTRPEIAAGDTTCGAGGGELGRDLRVRFLAVGPGGGTTGPAVFDAALVDLEDATVLDPDLPGGTSRSFRVEVTLPGSSPNDTQSDLITFDIELVLEQLVGSETVVLLPFDPIKEPERSPLVPPLVPPAPEVAGVTVEQPPGGTGGATGAGGTSQPAPPVGTLPRTGTETGDLVQFGAMSILAGLALRTLVGRRGRDRSPRS